MMENLQSGLLESILKEAADQTPDQLGGAPSKKIDGAQPSRHSHAPRSWAEVAASRAVNSSGMSDSGSASTPTSDIDEAISDAELESDEEDDTLESWWATKRQAQHQGPEPMVEE